MRESISTNQATEGVPIMLFALSLPLGGPLCSLIPERELGCFIAAKMRVDKVLSADSDLQS